VAAPGEPPADPAAAPAPSRPGAAPPGVAAPGDRGAAPARGYTPPAWVFPLGLATALEPAAVIVLHFINPDFADGHLVAYAVVGGLFITMPSLAILGLAVIWHRRLITAAGETIPGVPPALSGPTASRISAISLAASTILFGLLLAVLLGGWAILALPPLALSLASAWLMNDAAAARTRGAGA
jgi:hypothetical protein